jgi:CheY-like chemotaxis protein
MLNKNISILLIDDNDITREVLRVVLRNEDTRLQVRRQTVEPGWIWRSNYGRT